MVLQQRKKSPLPNLDIKIRCFPVRLTVGLVRASPKRQGGKSAQNQSSGWGLPFLQYDKIRRIARDIKLFSTRGAAQTGSCDADETLKFAN